MLGGILRGKRTLLRVPTEADIDGIARWAADMRVRGALTRAYWDEPDTRATSQERLTNQSEDIGSVLWAIEADGALAGSCRVEFNVEPGADHIDVTLFTIDPERWSQVLGSDA